ncbi:MAG: hypothetical protein H7Y03_08235, partial [Chitinophagaceae bacterium]|nr:hypothetical protein [Chitinophagaceae bacterium]
NSRGRSCIPEGKYRLETRYSSRYNDHLQVAQVPGRTLILLHPANNAVRELKGCIAPVSELTGPGRGMGSRVAFQKVKKRVYDAIRAGERVWLVIGSSAAPGR